MSVTLLIVDLWQYCEYCIRSGITRCTLFMVICLGHICQCGLGRICQCITTGRICQCGYSAHRHTCTPPHCRTSQYRRTFIQISVSLRKNLADTRFDGVGLADFKSRANVFLLASAALYIFVFYYFPLSLLSVYMLVLWGWGLWTDRE